MDLWNFEASDDDVLARLVEAEADEEAGRVVGGADLIARLRLSAEQLQERLARRRA